MSPLSTRKTRNSTRIEPYDSPHDPGRSSSRKRNLFESCSSPSKPKLARTCDAKRSRPSSPLSEFQIMKELDDEPESRFSTPSKDRNTPSKKYQHTPVKKVLPRTPVSKSGIKTAGSNGYPFEISTPTTPKSKIRTSDNDLNILSCKVMLGKPVSTSEVKTAETNGYPFSISTPTTPKLKIKTNDNSNTPLRKSIYNTPKATSRMKNEPTTPRTPIDEVRANLHISAVPKSLPCRQAEFKKVYDFLVRKIDSNSGGVMYISGVPGTGKTATVHKVIETLRDEAEVNSVDSFTFIEVNALRITEPRQAYCKIWKDLTGESLSVAAAQNALEKKFSRPAKGSVIILIDELDYLCNRRQDVIYNILDWSTKRDARLIVLTIANTMDLPERTLKGRVTSRMGLTRLLFQPYNNTQLQEIVLKRLDNNNIFHPDAVQLVARKVASVSGDARRALDICRRATELVDNGTEQITIKHVNSVLNSIFSCQQVEVIRNCCEAEKLILRAIRDESLRTGVEETILKKMYQTFTSLCHLESLHVPDIGCISQACTRLANMGLIIAEKNCKAYLYRKLTLNVSADDVHYALDLKEM